MEGLGVIANTHDPRDIIVERVDDDADPGPGQEALDFNFCTATEIWYVRQWFTTKVELPVPEVQPLQKCDGRTHL
jgi:hypothetical protein